MNTVTAKIRHPLPVWRSFGLSAFLTVSCGACAFANAALHPPTGYLAPVQNKPGVTQPCVAAPPPFTATLDFPSKYAGSGSSRDEVNPEADEQFKQATQPITQMEKGFSALVTKYMRSGDPAQLTCAINWLSTWASARALEGEAPNHTGKSLRKWSLGSIASAYLRLKFSVSAPLEEFRAQRAQADEWLSEVAERVEREWPADDPIAKFNNHYYWAAWAMMSAGVATNRRDLFDHAVAIYHVFATQVDPDGYLPNELARASRAAGYHDYALLPLAMIAAFAKANGSDLAPAGGWALTRLARRVEVAIDDPASFAIKTGVQQDPNAMDSKSAWAWLEPYCWTVPCTSRELTQLSAQRPLAVTRLGGDLSAVFSGAPLL